MRETLLAAVTCEHGSTRMCYANDYCTSNGETMRRNEYAKAKCRHVTDKPHHQLPDTDPQSTTGYYLGEHPVRSLFTFTHALDYSDASLGRQLLPTLPTNSSPTSTP